MTWLRIKTEGGRTAFRPGETLAGTADWQLDPAPHSHPSPSPRAIELRLLWSTTVEGSSSSSNFALVDRMRFDPAPAAGSGSFRFELPAGPYSFDGRVITLSWALEAVVGEEILGRMEITVSPTGQPVRVEPDL